MIKGGKRLGNMGSDSKRNMDGNSGCADIGRQHRHSD